MDRGKDSHAHLADATQTRRSQETKANARAHQSPTAAAVQIEALLDDGTVALSLIQALIPVGRPAVDGTLQPAVLAVAAAR